MPSDFFVKKSPFYIQAQTFIFSILIYTCTALISHVAHRCVVYASEDSQPVHCFVELSSLKLNFRTVNIQIQCMIYY